MSNEIPKVYNPTEVEQKWYKFWEENKLFTPEENSSKKPFTIVIPPPNVTGNLHMGHALDNSIQDVLIRYKKLKGFNALWVPGTDHAGIATQNVVAKALKKEGERKEDLGRENFVERVWKWKEEYGGNITRQLRRLGASLDWTRERFTMDEGLSKAVTHEFVALYNEGLIYRGKRLINWCAKCGTAISDIEVEHEMKKGNLWYIKYPVESTKVSVTVATTRPETMLGDTAVAVNPKDKRYKKLIGKMLVLPLVNRKIPIIKDDFVDPKFGTGAVKVTPAHDPNDFEMGERHELPRINILTKDAKITFEEFADEDKQEISEIEGMDRFKARQRIVELLEEKGFLEKIEDYETSIGECYRCKTVIEPYLSDQWYVKVKELARKAIKAVEDGKIKYVPNRWTKIYINWMTNLRDWCISRQLWWGHRIPVWYRGDEIYVGEEPPKGDGWEQDPDVFDTWFSSALWPFSTLGWPEKTKDLQTFYPTDVLVTGYDIITFWVSRMIMMGMHFMKKAPFHTVFIHGLVRDAKGKKMSKSFGNVIDPIEIIDKVGADALRFALISLITGQGQDIKLTPDKITEARNFTNKIWNVARFVLMAMEPEAKSLGSIDPDRLELPDKWIISRNQNLAAEVDKLIDGCDFGEAARKIYDFLWGDFCDWYVEISKKDLYSEDKTKKEKTLSVLLYVLERTLRVMHPFMPFISEETWQILTNNLQLTTNNLKSIILSKWPKVDNSLIDEKTEKSFNLVKELIVKIRNIKAEMGVQTKDIELIIVSPKRDIDAGAQFIKSLAKVSSISVQKVLKSKPEQSATGVVHDVQFFIPLKGLVDIEKEVERLKKEDEKIDKELSHLNKLLSNKNFVDKADPVAVERQRSRQKELAEKKTIIAARIKDLS
ncbi:MAG: valine--tRNA ligase [Candidatus Margulisiibacteriota bacterium]|nr:valine--tRNA ligase [Candidatus Margulisiibacteriota bacterium]